MYGFVMHDIVLTNYEYKMEGKDESDDQLATDETVPAEAEDDSLAFLKAQRQRIAAATAAAQASTDSQEQAIQSIMNLRKRMAEIDALVTTNDGVEDSTSGSGRLLTSSEIAQQERDAAENRKGQGEVSVDVDVTTSALSKLVLVSAAFRSAELPTSCITILLE